MRIYLMTDLEGVAGVLNFDDWCEPQSRYYETAKEFLTREVNAAVEGFLEGGATEIVVWDGHGYGGINISLLHPAVQLIRGWRERPWPLLLNEGKYDAIAWVGQHAKAGTLKAHLAHTQGFNYRDESINGVSVGEFGQLAMCASELGIRAIFGAGDEAFMREAQALVPGIEAVAVKRGTNPVPGHALPQAAYMNHNLTAIHLPPEEARKRIRAAARRAGDRARNESFGIIPLKPPFERVTVLRSDEKNPPRISRCRHPSSVAAVLNMPFDFQPVDYDPMSLLDAFA